MSATFFELVSSLLFPYENQSMTSRVTLLVKLLKIGIKSIFSKPDCEKHYVPCICGSSHMTIGMYTVSCCECARAHVEPMPLYLLCADELRWNKRNTVQLSRYVGRYV